MADNFSDPFIKAGYQVDVVYGVDKVLGIAPNVEYKGIVFTTARGNRMDKECLLGKMVVEELRNHNPLIPIAVFTGAASTTVNELKQLGATLVVVKPRPNAAELIFESINSHIGQSLDTIKE